jgi:hypothetical protein
MKGVHPSLSPTALWLLAFEGSSFFAEIVFEAGG